MSIVCQAMKNRLGTVEMQDGDWLPAFKVLSFWWLEIDTHPTSDKQRAIDERTVESRENINLVVKGMLVEGTWEVFVMEMAFAMVFEGTNMEVLPSIVSFSSHQGFHKGWYKEDNCCGNIWLDYRISKSKFFDKNENIYSD